MSDDSSDLWLMLKEELTLQASGLRPFTAFIDTETSGTVTMDGGGELIPRLDGPDFQDGAEVLGIWLDARRRIILGSVKHGGGGGANPVVEARATRDGSTTGNFDNTAGATLSSLQITLANLDPASKYYVEASAEALLQAAVDSTFVQLGVRIGLSNAIVWGYGHRQTSQTQAAAVAAGTFTGVTSLLVSTLAKNSVAGAQIIGGGLLRVRAWRV